MLNHLSIQGLAIIDSLDIDLSHGFNVLTGETGAGKSILIKALNYLMGAKASPDAVRQGSPQAMITGQFRVPKVHASLVTLENLGVPFEEDETGVNIVLRRQITAKGRSQSWVNDVVITNQPLRELGANLVDVFGQHENQRMMNPSEHMGYVDTFLKDQNPLKRVERLNQACHEKIRGLETLLNTFQNRQKDRDYLTFRMEALKNFAPSAEDFERVSGLLQRSEHSVELRDTLNKSLSCLGGDGVNSVAASVRECAKILSGRKAKSADPELQALGGRAEDLAAGIDDLNYELEKLAGGFDVDEAELDSAQKRLFDYQDLFRKHSVRDLPSLLAESERLETELAFLESAAAQIQDTLEDLTKKTKELVGAARDLTQARQKATASIKKSVEGELHDLAMPGSRFEIELSPVQRHLPEIDLTPLGESLQTWWDGLSQDLSKVSDSGAEKAQFMLASNKGENLMALSKVASGGELSRIMLAFKRSLAVDAETCVLVFDEIDTGISGRVADVVGKKMQELAGRFQVICISHLPQVAVYADTHFLVSKKVKGQRTETSLVRLSDEESAKEIARLLSGSEVSRPSLANAKSLIEKAHAKKILPRKEKSRKSTEAELH